MRQVLHQSGALSRLWKTFQADKGPSLDSSLLRSVIPVSSLCACVSLLSVSSPSEPAASTWFPFIAPATGSKITVFMGCKWWQKYIFLSIFGLLHSFCFTTCLYFKKEEEEEAETSEVFPVCLYLAVLLFHVAEGKWFLQCGPERDR